MKTLFYSAIAVLSLFFVSCKKEGKTPDAPTPKEEKVPVRFTVAGFGNEVIDMDARKAGVLDAGALRDSALQRSVKHLYMLGYQYINNTWTRVTSIHQDYAVDSTHFGILSDTLTPGPHIIVIVGADTPPVFSPTATLGWLEFNGPNGARPVPDLFYKYMYFVVNGQDSIPNSNLVLPRIIGNLEVNILDAIDRGPGMDSVEVTMHTESKMFDFSWDMGTDNSMDRKLSRKSLTKYADNVINVYGSFSVTIKYTNRVTGAITTKVVNNVRCYPGKKTVLSGNIYTTDPNGFKISINDTWAPGGDVIPF